MLSSTLLSARGGSAFSGSLFLLEGGGAMFISLAGLVRSLSPLKSVY